MILLNLTHLNRLEMKGYLKIKIHGWTNTVNHSKKKQDAGMTMFLKTPYGNCFGKVQILFMIRK